MVRIVGSITVGLILIATVARRWDMPFSTLWRAWLRHLLFRCSLPVGLAILAFSVDMRFLHLVPGVTPGAQKSWLAFAILAAIGVIRLLPGPAQDVIARLERLRNA